METQKKHCKTLNCTLTKRVIELHDRGYTEDFRDTPDKRFICIQSSEQFKTSELIICLVDLGFDKLSNSFKYIHTIETADGSKGLMITNAIYSVNSPLSNQFC